MERELTDNLYDFGNGRAALPTDVESERAVLSLCIRNQEILDKVVSKKLSASDFFEKKHSMIFEVMTKLFLDGKSVDPYTVNDALTKSGSIEKVGGSAYVLNLADSPAVVSNIDNYIDIICEKSKLRAIIAAMDEMMKLTYSGQTGVNDVIDIAVTKFSSLREAPEGIGFESLNTILRRNLNDINAIISGKNKSNAIMTGFRGLDYMLGGLRPGTLNVLAARPGMGKSALVINIAVNVAEKYNGKVNLFSLEMSKTEIGNRIISSRTNTTAKKLQKANLTREEELEIAKSLIKLYPLNIYIDDNSNVTPVSMLSKCKELKASGQLGLVIVDYLQLMTMPGKGNNYSRQQEISDISRSLKVMAKELEIPIIALSQLSRGSEKRDDHTPMLSDLRDSGAIEQDADSVFFIERNSYYNKEENSSDIQDAKIIVAKNRHGEIGTVKLKWMGSRTLFFEEDRPYDPVDPLQGVSAPDDKQNSAYTRTVDAGAAASDYKFDEVIDTPDQDDSSIPPPSEENHEFFSNMMESNELPSGFFGN